MKEILDVLKSFNTKQWAAVVAIVGGCLSAFAWVESHYASKDTTDMILENLITIDSKLSAIITTQFTKEEIDKIQENARLYEQQMRRYIENGPSK